MIMEFDQYMIRANLMRLIAQSMLFFETLLFVIFVCRLERGVYDNIEYEKQEYGYTDEHFAK